MATDSTVAPSRWWSPFGRMEELAFKKVAEGWVYQAPNPWLIGPRRHYLVNDAQKSELATELKHMWSTLMMAIIGLVAFGLPLTLSLMDKYPVTVLVVSMIAGAVVGGSVAGHTVRRLRPIIAGLTPTSLRIAQRETILGQVSIFSQGQIAFLGLLSIALLALQLLDPLVFKGGWTAISVAGSIMFGAATIYWAALFIAKCRAGNGAA